MEFQITLGRHGPDVNAVNRMLLDADPAAVVDRDPSGTTLRVATALAGLDLLMALRGAGWPIDPAQFKAIPSTCCGGCGG